MSRARDLADSRIIDVTSSFTRNSAWSASGTERVYHDPLSGLVYYQLGLFIDATTEEGANTTDLDHWVEPTDGTVIYTIASAYRPAESFVTNFVSEYFDSGTATFNTNGNVTLAFPQNWDQARYRVYINGWYKI